MAKSINRDYSAETLTPIVNSSVNFCEVIRKLNIPLSGRMHSYVRRVIGKLGIATTHFTGKPAADMKSRCSRPKAWQDVLVKRNDGFLRRTVASALRKALISSGIPYKCNKCDLPPLWNGTKLTLQVNHINGDCYDDRRDNLEFLCPNCHAQVPINNHIEQVIKTSDGVIVERIPRIDSTTIKCQRCGIEVSYGAEKCRKCCDADRMLNTDKITGVSQDKLKCLVWNYPMSKLAKFFEITPNALKRRCLKRNIPIPSNGHWQRNYKNGTPTPTREDIFGS